MKPKSLKSRYTGKSFATASRKISDKYKDRDTNMLSKRSFLAEIEELMKMQEVVRSQEASVNTLQENRRLMKKYGGELMKYANGTPGIPEGTYLGLSGSFNPALTEEYKTKFPNTQLLGQQPILTSPNINKPTSSINISVPSNVLTNNNKGLDLLPTRPRITSFQDRVKSEFNAMKPLVEQKVQAQSNTKANKFKQYLTSMEGPLAVGKGIEALGGLAMLASGYDKYSPILNPYESQSRRELESMKFDITPIQQRLQQEAARGRSSVSGIQNEAVRQALLQNTQSEVMGKAQEAMLSGQQQNNQYSQIRAAGLQGLGAEQVAARNLSEQLTTQSKAGWQQGIQNMLGSVGQAGQEITNKRANIAQQQLLASTLKTKNFEIQDVSSIFKKAMSMGKMTVDDMLKFTQMDEQGQSKYVEEMKKNIGDDLKPSTTTTTKTTVAKRFGGILPGLKI